MIAVLAASLTLAAAAVTGPSDLPDPTAQELASSISTYRIEGSISKINLGNSITKLRTETKTGDQTVVAIGSDVLFDFGSATLTETASAKVRELAARVSDKSRPVSVTGYTDSVGDEQSNQRLSEQRAEAVATVLRSASPGLQVQAAGKGEADPVAPNESGGKDDPIARAKNRRVAISFTGS